MRYSSKRRRNPRCETYHKRYGYAVIEAREGVSKAETIEDEEVDIKKALVQVAPTVEQAEADDEDKKFKKKSSKKPAKKTEKKAETKTEETSEVKETKEEN